MLKSSNEKRSWGARSFIRSAKAMARDKTAISRRGAMVIGFFIVGTSNPRDSSSSQATI